MEGYNHNNKRIAKNTLVLYFRMLFLMIISLYTSRVILDTLGIVDYGIHNVVAGFITMFSMISLALVNANTRFINFELGRGDFNRLSLVFSTAVTVHVGIALLFTLVAETIGLWYLNHVMVIPQDRIIAANWCYQFSIFNFCLGMINIPYRACIIAHEKMKTFAYVSILEGLGQLLISFVIIWNPFDRLIYYALLLFLLQNLIRYIYQSYCRKHFSECHYKFIIDKRTIIQILSFSSWNMFGNGATLLKTHGGSLILNLFFGPTVNAARGLSVHVSHAVASFSTNFLMAITPQITQSYAKGDYSYLMKLVCSGARFSFYLLFVISLPIIFNIDYILHIWLKDVPAHTAIFVQLAVINSIIYAITRPLVTAQNATGNVKAFQLTIGAVELLNLPIAYLVLWCGYPPASVLIVSVVLEIVAVFVRIFMVPQTMKEFSTTYFIKDVIVKCSVVSLLSIIIPLLLIKHDNESFIYFIVSCIVCVLSSAFVILTYGLSRSERLFMMDRITQFKKKH